MANILLHRGVAHDDNPPGRGSGRFEYGSGENPGQHQFTFISEVNRLKKNGISDGEIAKMLLGEHAKANDLKAELSIQKSEQRRFNRERAVELLKKYDGNKSKVARHMGVNESVVRSYLKQVESEYNDRYQNTAAFLKSKVDDLGMIDVTSGTELWMGTTKNVKDVAVRILVNEGYKKVYTKIPQLGNPGKETTRVILASPDMSWSDVQKNKLNVKQIVEFTPDNGKTFFVPEYPESLSSKRIMVRYAEEGGKSMDGVMQIRRGVEDLSLGKSQYAQCRVAVDGTHYMKGMAIYGDDSEFPKGIDVIYNTNKSKGTPMIGEKDHEVLKRLKDDKDNPFGATIKAGGQYHFVGKDGKDHLSPINKLQEEGDWDNWSRNLSSQFLSKQSVKLIKQQLDLSIEQKKKELSDIQKLTNPVIKQKLLDEFASGCDANAASLHAVGFKGQAFKVILPVPKMKSTEIYDPSLNDGEKVALVRYPHGGIFEIPILTVNNKNNPAKSFMNMANDAVGIHPDVAEQLSGADFDGDTVLRIPLTRNGIKIQSRSPIEDLQSFDGKILYKLPDDAPKMKDRTKQRQMGEVSNLITDMTVAGAPEDDIVRAVKHSMVVIDAQKHHLDYKRSAEDFDINSLKAEYQGVNPVTGAVRGASTILSRSGSEAHPYKLKEITRTSEMTPEELKRWNEGKIVYRETGEMKTKWKEIKNPDKMTLEELEVYKTGKKVFRNTGEERVTQKIEQMYLYDNARDLVRDKNNEKEMAYADYANDLKALANQARKESRSIKPIPVNKSSAKVYEKEVSDLKNKLIRAEMNRNREAQAQIIANAEVAEKKKSNPELASDYEHLKREQNQALQRARASVGAKRDLVVITDREWEAIQANALSTNVLKKILNNTDEEAFKQRATPRESSNATKLSDSKIARIRAMAASGKYTQAEIASALGISVSTVSDAINN